ncbi:MAG: hypothetical protein JST90_00725 [Bacteroidetes bacterium]|nr:hypothetical protein [Bacteroidota bacterium]
MNETEKKEKLSTSQEIVPADWFLSLFVNLANKTGLGFDITIVTQGYLVCGKLISGKQYFEETSAMFKDNPSEIAETLATSIESYGDKIYGEGGDKPVPPPSYIHLKEARFFNGQSKPLPANRGVLWRGRLSEVSGFFIGILNSETT